MEHAKHKDGEKTRVINVGSLNLPQYIMAGLLIVAAFWVGSLYTKVQYLQKGVAGGVADTGKQAAPQTPAARPTVGPVPEISSTDRIKGNKNADIVFIEYSDAECPLCKTFHETMNKIMEEYGDKVAWIWRQYPLSFHANAQKEAEAMECAGELGGDSAFWKYLDTMMERTTSNGTGFALDALVPLAKELGLNEAKFKDCLDSGKYAQKTKDDMTGGQKAGIQGTPGTVILNVKTKDQQSIPGALPFDQVKALVDKALE